MGGGGGPSALPAGRSVVPNSHGNGSRLTKGSLRHRNRAALRRRKGLRRGALRFGSEARWISASSDGRREPAPWPCACAQAEARNPSCSSTGSGPPTSFFLPAAAGKALAGRAVILPDLPGHGDSEDPAGFACAMDDLADLLMELLDWLGLSRVSLVGHSMGGTIAMLMAERDPGRFTKPCSAPRATCVRRTPP